MHIHPTTQNVSTAEPAERKEAAAHRSPLSDSALVLLSTASNRDDGSILPPPADLKTRGGALKAVLAHLLARGLVEEMPVRLDTENWRHDDEAGRVGLRITWTGCAAIGLDAEGNVAAEPESGADLTLSSALELGMSEDARNAEASGDSGEGADAAAEAIDGTIVWTYDADTVVGPRDSVAAAGATAESTSTRRTSKQDQIIALLSQDEGATIDVLMAATGWLPHTVRAVLSGLRKKGYRIDRQKQSDTGSVYRFVPSPMPPAEPAASEAAD